MCARSRLYKHLFLKFGHVFRQFLPLVEIETSPLFYIDLESHFKRGKIEIDNYWNSLQDRILLLCGLTYYLRYVVQKVTIQYDASTCHSSYILL